DLPVLDDVDGAVLVRDRLVAALEVDDREPPRGEAGAALDERALGVGPAVDERRAHLRQLARVDGTARGDDSADPAHGPTLERWIWPRASGATTSSSCSASSPRWPR